MNNKRSVIALIIAYAIFLGFYIAICCPGPASAAEKQCRNFIKSDDILVKYKNDPALSVVNIPEKAEYAYRLESLKNDSQVEYAEPDYLYQAAALVKYDPFFRNQWYLQKVKAPEAWDKISESPSVTIAILDTGVDISHPDLKANVWTNSKEIPGNKKDDDHNGYIDDINGWDFVNGVPDPSPKFTEGFTEDGIMHGTIIAGIAAARGGNGEGIYGTTWNTRIMALKVLDDKGEGSTASVVNAIDYAIANGANIINLSFVGPGYSLSLENAVKRAHLAGLIVIAAAGNEQENGEGYSLDKTPMYPVCHDGPNSENWIIGVAATDAIDQKAPFSSYGFKCVDITAPGVSIYSTVAYYPDRSVNSHNFNIYYDGYWSGTSVATPIVTGAVSLILEANPSLKSKQAIDNLLNGADNIYRVNPNFLGQLGRGRLNMLSSIELAKTPLNDFRIDILSAPYSKGSSTIKVLDSSGNPAASSTILAYEPNFTGGINVISADINGDKKYEIITSPNQGGGPRIKIFNTNGKLVGQFLAYNKNFNGGVNIAAGDINGDGMDEIITGPGPGGGPHIRVFNAKGQVLRQFFAYGKNFSGGVSVASGDMNSDGRHEIITGPGPGGGPHIRVFASDGKVIGQFFAYDKKFAGGVRVASGDVDPLKYGLRDEIITVPWSQGTSLIKIFNFKFDLLDQWLAFHPRFRGGVNLSVADLDNDGRDEVITGAGPGGGPQVITYEADGTLVSSFYALKESFSGGVSVGAVRINREIYPF